MRKNSVCGASPTNACDFKGGGQITTKGRHEVSPRSTIFVVMIKKYKQLTLAQRSQISALIQTKTPRKVISEIVGISQSTLSRELSRNKNRHGRYIAAYAHDCAMIRRERIVSSNRRVKGYVIKEALTLLRMEQFSPEQISEVLAIEGKQISHETIYKIIRSDTTGELAKQCRHKMNYRHHGITKRPKAGKNLIPNRVSIHDRPEAANGKRFGDWEMDLIIGKGGKKAILTLIERSTNNLIMAKLPMGKRPDYVAKMAISLLFPYRKDVITITTDNGLEFMRHDIIEKELKTKVYYADPYSSWQKGAIENTNKLIRQYIPKGANFDDFSDEDITQIQYKLNRRPRKKLGFKCPRDVFFSSLHK